MNLWVSRYGTVALSLLTISLAGCGGGGGSALQAATTSVMPPIVSTPSPAAGPVTYLQSSGSMSTSGTIVAGTHEALVAVMSGATTASAYSSDTLSVTTSANVQTASRTAKALRTVAPPRVPQPEAFAADDGELLARLQSLRSNAPAAPVRRAESVLSSALSIGSTAPIWVQKGSLSGSRVNVQVPATLVAQTAHANIWMDGTLQLPQSAIAQIGADFENAYASDTAHFASPDYPSNAPALQPEYSACAVGGAKQGSSQAYITEPADHRIDVMVVNSSNLGGLGGYFSGANLMKQSTLNCLNGSQTTYESNEAPFIFVGWFASSGSTYELQEDLVRSTAHEFQHLINFVNHTILAPGASSSSFNGEEATYVNEGLSMLAQDLAVQNMYGSHGVQFDVDDAMRRASVYLAAPSNFSLSGFSGIDPSNWGGNSTAQYNCGGGCYGVAYLFQRYLRDRFGDDSYTHAMETSGVIGDANLQRATGETAAGLFGDFALAMAADSLQVTTSDARFHFGSLNLSGSYADQFGASTALGGLAAQSYTGDSLSVAAPVGGFAFVSMGAVPADGTPVSVADRSTVSGFGLLGGLAEK